MVTIQKYIKAQSLKEAYELNQVRTNRIIAGMLWTKLGNNSIGTAIDLCELKLDYIEETEDEFSIGAMTTLRSLEKHEGLAKYTNGAMAQAVKDIVGTQFRNMATVGGSIWGRYGFSDVLTFFLSMDSYVELYNAGIVSLEEFSRMKYDRDVLVRVIVKKSSGRFIYDSMRASRTDFPILACATSYVGEEYRAVIGARPGRAIVIRDNENILAGGITEESAARLAEYVAANTPTQSNLRGSAEYRTHLAKVLTYRNLMQLGGL